VVTLLFVVTTSRVALVTEAVSETELTALATDVRYVMVE
jgi:hypothetical protein